MKTYMFTIDDTDDAPLVMVKGDELILVSHKLLSVTLETNPVFVIPINKVRYIKISDDPTTTE